MMPVVEPSRALFCFLEDLGVGLGGGPAGGCGWSRVGGGLCLAVPCLSFVLVFCVFA